MKKNFGEGIALGIIIGVSVSMIVLVTVVLPEYKKSVLGSSGVPRTNERKSSPEYTMTDKNTVVTFKTRSHEVYR
jgi:hypothetical protein